MRQTLRTGTVLLLLFTSGCVQRVSRTTQLTYLEQAPPPEQCQQIEISPSSISPWVLVIDDTDAAYLIYGSRGAVAAFPPGTFVFHEVHVALSQIQAVSPAPQDWCKIEFLMPYEYYEDPSIKWPRSQSRYRLTTGPGDPTVHKLFHRAADLCEEHLVVPHETLAECLARSPIRDIR